MELQRAINSNREQPNTVSQTEVDRLKFVRDKAALDIRQAEHDMREAELNVERAENELALAKLAVERRALVAPISGQVVEIHRHRGEWVQPGETVVRIVNTDVVRAEVLVTLAEVPDEVKGRPVQVTLAAPGRQESSFRGTVVFVDPRINAVNGEFRIWAEIDNSAQLLRPGHRAKLQILPAVSPAVDAP
jgi:RND family efflux transporter MFP subunit